MRIFLMKILMPLIRKPIADLLRKNKDNMVHELNKLIDLPVLTEKQEKIIIDDLVLSVITLLNRQKLD